MQTKINNQQDVGFIEKLVHVGRVAKVVKGGRRFSFNALVVVGNGKGQVGFATGKAREVPDAVKKATERAKRKMFKIPLREGRTLHHGMNSSFGAAKVCMRPAPSGTGIIAGGAMRAVFEALGLHDVVSKSLGTNNKGNLVRATVKGLMAIKSPREVANSRSKKIRDIISDREFSTQFTGEESENNNIAQEEDCV